jgi:hypothetical protein
MLVCCHSVDMIAQDIVCSLFLQSKNVAAVEEFVTFLSLIFGRNPWFCLVFYAYITFMAQRLSLSLQ